MSGRHIEKVKNHDDGPRKRQKKKKRRIKKKKTIMIRKKEDKVGPTRHGNRCHQRGEIKRMKRRVPLIIGRPLTKKKLKKIMEIIGAKKIFMREFTSRANKMIRPPEKPTNHLTIPRN